MPNVNDTVTYTSTINPAGTLPVSRTWSLDAGGVIQGVSTNPTVQIQWVTPGTYTLTCTCTNGCDTETSHFQIIVIQAIWEYTHTQTECANFTRDNCSGGCTPTSATYCRDATETRDSTISQQQAITNAVAAATISAQQLVNAGGQDFANANATCNCPCSEVWTESGLILCGLNINNDYGTSLDVCKQYKELTNQCNSNKDWQEQSTNTSCPGCVQPCTLQIGISTTNNGTNYIVTTTATGGNGTIELSQNGGINYGTLGNSVLGAGSYTFCIREASNTACTSCQSFTLANICNPNNWTNAGGQYCNGIDLVQNQVNECGGTQTIIVQANSSSCCTSNWVDDGINFTCGQNIGQDPCIVYKQQIDGCGNSRWVFSSNNTTCGGCCDTSGITSTTISLNTGGGFLGVMYHYNLNNNSAMNFDYSIGASYVGVGNAVQTIPTAYHNGVGGTNPGPPLEYAFPLPFNLQVGDQVTVRYWLSGYNPLTCFVQHTYTVIP